MSFQPASYGPGPPMPRREHLEGAEVEVHGVVEVGDEPPDLDRAELRRRGDVVGAERLAVDQPARHVVDVARPEAERRG